jgi:hypothetical protein
VVVYKIDRLSRSLVDFTKLVEVFDANQVAFVSVTQSFNATTSMGRLTLNILLSFAQFEGAARDAPVVVAVADEHPALGALAGDEGLAGLALGIEGVELHVEPFLARLPGVDCAAQLSDGRRHYNRVRPHSSLGYRPPAPETVPVVRSQISSGAGAAAMVH